MRDHPWISSCNRISLLKRRVQAFFARPDRQRKVFRLLAPVTGPEAWKGAARRKQKNIFLYGMTSKGK